MTSYPSEAAAAAAGVKGYSPMRPYHMNGHQLLPDAGWSPVVDAYYDDSDTEDTGAGICRVFRRYAGFSNSLWNKMNIHHFYYFIIKGQHVKQKIMEHNIQKWNTAS